MGDDLVDQVLSSDNNLLEQGLGEAMPERTKKTDEPPNWNTSEPRITGISSLNRLFYDTYYIVLSFFPC